MRISDWSSDVCSSDLKVVPMLQRYEETYGIASFDLAVDFGWFWFLTKPIFQALHWANGQLGNFGLAILALTVVIKLIFRSEEHTSELQSLMRIAYAVFCLKQKQYITQYTKSDTI